MSNMGILVIISAIAALSGTVAWLLRARSGSDVSPEPTGIDGPDAAREQELLNQIDRVYEEIPDEFWHRYHELVAQRDAATLIRDGPEHQELIRMTDQVEEWNARRVGLLLDLAKLRKTSIDEVMREFRPRAVAHD